jgi:uncharacterized protein
MAIKIGPPVDGDDFWGRNKLLSDAVEELLAGNHLSINAPRRVGKTSFVQRLQQQMKQQHNWPGVFADVSGAADELDFAKRLLDALAAYKKNWGKEFVKYFDGVELELASLLKIKVPGKAPTSVETTLQELGNIIKKINQPFILALDELPVFLQDLVKAENGPERTKRLLYYLRSFKISQKIKWFGCIAVP